MAKCTVELSVPGMTGDGVVRHIESALGGTSGVEYAHVNLGAGKITIQYNDLFANADQLIGTVEKLGFKPTRV